MCFFSPSSVTESPLSLRRFKFTEKSIASFSLFFLYFFCIFLFSLFSLFFFVVVDNDGFFAVVVVTVGKVVAVIAFVIWFSVVLTGSSFFNPPLCTWVHPSSLSGWSPVSCLGLSPFAGAVVAAAAAIVVVVIVVAVVVTGVVVLVVF